MQWPFMYEKVLCQTFFYRVTPQNLSFSLTWSDIQCCGERECKRTKDKENNLLILINFNVTQLSFLMNNFLLSLNFCLKSHAGTRSRLNSLFTFYPKKSQIHSKLNSHFLSISRTTTSQFMGRHNIDLKFSIRPFPITMILRL